MVCRRRIVNQNHQPKRGGAAFRLSLPGEMIKWFQKISAMNKQEIAAALRHEVGHLELEIKKLHARCERLKRFVLDLEEEIAPPAPAAEPDSKFRKAIDLVFGEKPKRPKR